MNRNSYSLQKATLCTANRGTNSRIIPEQDMAKVHVYYFGSNFNFSIWIHSRQVSAGASKNRNILVNSLVELLYMLNSPDNITSNEHLSNVLHKQHQGTVLQHWTTSALRLNCSLNARLCCRVLCIHPQRAMAELKTNLCRTGLNQNEEENLSALVSWLKDAEVLPTRS